MSDAAAENLQIEPASPLEAPRALERVFGHLPAAERQQHVDQILAESTDGCPAQVWIARRGGRHAGAALAQIRPGRTAAIWPPRLSDGEPIDTARRLLATAVDALAAERVRLGQVLLETDHGPDAQLLEQSGFRHTANLLYLVSLAGAFPTSEPNDGLDFMPYTTAGHARMAEIVRQSYVGSQDCPAIDGLRDIDDVLASYRASGQFDPARWLIAARDGADVGCLLLADCPHESQWELVYLGVAPRCRGRGWGLALARRAQWLAREASRTRLVLAVDAANAPALAIYAAAGFVTWSSRSLFLRVF